ncbi:RBR-type E3 ubiquitin transferase [Coniochaeta hoffmannii]|uniref:RBR-type E3 ubiquitin transferase n=1 Tax=Coniochaeta hoffmannii TaxID=91930 RepID=A0AA38W3Q7_9PEZI|nr:RBR-type E3 ubiquitin transferase [Coniochaeta hoffmannii]
MTDRESLDFYNQVETKRRQVMEQRSSMMSGSVDEEVDWTKYEPPEALQKLPNITSETIIAVVQSSLVNIKNQIQAEQLRAQEQQSVVLEEAEAEAAAAAAEAENGKSKERASPDGIKRWVDPRRPAALPTPPSSIDFTHPPLDMKPQRRSRFGISRILRHVRGNSETSKSETHSSSHALTRSTPLHTRIPASTDLPPTPFTQSIYKRFVKPPSPGSAPQGEQQQQHQQQVECVSCFDDVPKKDAVKAVCHHYCRDCFARLIRTAVDNEAQWPPKCCLNPVPFRTIAKYAPRDLLASYRLRAEEFGTPIESRLYCPQPDCGAWIRKTSSRHDAATRTATCSACGHAACTMCRGAAHPADESCPQDRDTLLADRLAEEEGWRRCARCGVLVEHREACQHMTCRCGAEFCYVCGSAWRTCACTLAHLTEYKGRAAARRAERAAEEEAEMGELAEALRLVAEFEREEERKEEVRREEARRRREERRRREAEERVRREEARRAEMARKYEELRGTLAKLEELQRMVLDYGHDREMEGLAARAAEEKAKLAGEQDVEKREIRADAAAKVAERGKLFDGEYAVRVAWEKQLEGEYERIVSLFWSDKVDGPPIAREAVRVFRRQNDRHMDEWLEWKNGEMEKMRYLLDDEVAVREELMENSRRRLGERLEGEQAQAGWKQRAERRWFELVVEERKRLLAEVEVVERENGGEDDSPASGSGVSLESEGGWETEDEFDDFGDFEVDIER